MAGIHRCSKVATFILPLNSCWHKAASSQRMQSLVIVVALCAGCSEERLMRVWQWNGKFEPLKGIIFHKRVELYLQEIGAWQVDEKRKYVQLREIFLMPHVLERVRSAASVATAVHSVAANIHPSLWNHKVTQMCFITLLTARWDVPEFVQFEDWLRANSSLSPFRTEWSIYSEDADVAGQIVSLWFDVDKSGAVVMVDWKRVRGLLTSCLENQNAQAFCEMGVSYCHVAPEFAGPCDSFYDCAYNHYLIQQNIYAHF